MARQPLRNRRFQSTAPLVRAKCAAIVGPARYRDAWRAGGRFFRLEIPLCGRPLRLGAVGCADHPDGAGPVDIVDAVGNALAAED